MLNQRRPLDSRSGFELVGRIVRELARGPQVGLRLTAAGRARLGYLVELLDDLVPEQQARAWLALAVPSAEPVHFWGADTTETPSNKLARHWGLASGGQPLLLRRAAERGIV